MELYHGSNIEIAVPEIRESSRRLDFGTGFYTTSSFDQAKRWSLNKAKLEKSSDAVVSVYSVPDDLLCVETLKILNFEKADEKWLDFVIANRTEKSFTFGYDIVKGAVANDRVFASLNAFESGFMDKSTLLKELRTWVYVDQFSFHTGRALEYLTLVKAVRV